VVLLLLLALSELLCVLLPGGCRRLVPQSLVCGNTASDAVCAAAAEQPSHRPMQFWALCLGMHCG